MTFFQQRRMENFDFLRQVADRSPLLIYYTDEQGRFLFTSQRFADWFDRSPEDMVGKTLAEVSLRPEAFRIVAPLQERALRGETLNCNLKVARPGGPMIHYHCQFLPDKGPGGEAIRGLMMIAHDVTEREKNLQAIEASEKLFRSLTDTIPQLMWTSTADGQINFVNQRCLSYSGLASKEKFGAGWVDSLHVEDQRRVYQGWSESIEKGTPFREEYRLRNAAGEYRWFQGHAVPVRNAQGTIQYWIGTATDIEAEKRRESELQAAKEAAEIANRAKSSFLANMSHEIRTPLGIVLGFSELLDDDNLSSEDRKHYISSIARNGRMLTRLIDDILDLAKVESGRFAIDPAPFSLRKLMSEVMDLFSEKVREKQIELKVKVSPEVPDSILSDPIRVRQILINVIGNGVKFTSRGSVEVTVESHAQGDSRIEISIEVKDTGFGMSREQIKLLFTPFTQADNSHARRYGGTGLGLSLSKRLAQTMGGDISVKHTKPNEGTTFRVSFTAEVSHARLVHKVAAPVAKDDIKVNLKNMRILLVEDSEDNQELICSLLRNTGAVVDVASNGREGARKASHNSYHAILMDIQMPELDGYEAASLMRSKGCVAPIVALTAHAMKEERAKTKSAGFIHHLIKPINTRELHQVMSAVFHGNAHDRRRLCVDSKRILSVH